MQSPTTIESLRRYGIATLYLLLCPASLLSPSGLFAQEATKTEPQVGGQQAKETEEDYSAIDQHALKTPEAETQSLSRLATYLARPAKNDKQKARAFYRWITANIAYDVNAYLAHTSTHKNQQPDVVLQTRKAVCTGYSNLFAALAQTVGLNAVVISGQTRRATLPTLKADGTRSSSHAWNAVNIKGKWQLIDCTWGAGDTNLENRTFEFDFHPHYFFVPPSQLIYSHLPNNPEAQLLKRPLTLEQFERQPYLRIAAFQYGIKLLSHPEPVIAAKGQVKLTLKTSPETRLRVGIFQEGMSLRRENTFSQADSSGYRVFALFPRSGEYLLRIFAKKQGEEDGYDSVVDYKVVATEGMGEGAQFPKIYTSFENWNVLLHEPLSGILTSGTRQFFHVEVPGAFAVQVQSSAGTSLLEQNGNSFSGAAAIGAGNVTLYAKFSKEAEFKGFLTYIAQ